MFPETVHTGQFRCSTAVTMSAWASINGHLIDRLRSNCCWRSSRYNQLGLMLPQLARTHSQGYELSRPAS